MLDNTTADWFALRGREQDGWTAIQFKRQIDTCDPMDVPIKVPLAIVAVRVTRCLFVYLVRKQYLDLCVGPRRSRRDE